MKTLKDLTPEIEAKIPEYLARGLENVFDGGYYRAFDLKKAQACVNWNYKFCGFAEPEVIVAENPKEIVSIYTRLLEEKGMDVKSNLDFLKSNGMYLFTMNVYSNGYYQWNKFIKEEFKLPLSIEEEFEECFRLQRESGIYCALFLEDYCIVSKYPKRIHRNAQNNLHCVTGSAVEWGCSSPETRWDCFYVNGRNLEGEIFNRVIEGSYTFEEFRELDNEDLKGCIMTMIRERGGNQALMDFLGAFEVDSQRIEHEEGYEEVIKLYKTRETFSFVQNSKGESNQPYAWIHMVCPSTGTDYLIDTCPLFTDALECAKWHRPKPVPASLFYRWQSAN